MLKSKRLQPVCKFKKRKEEEAAKKLAESAQELSSQKQRLVDLQEYRLEYDEKYNRADSVQLDAMRVKEFHQFMAKLNTVIEQQMSAIEDLQVRYEETKRQWLAARNGAKLITNVQIRYQSEEMLIEEKKQQKEQDDLSALRFRR